MTEDRHERVSRIFLSARRLPPGQRAPFLERECAGDHDLRREVDSLLAHDVSSALIDSPTPAPLILALRDAARAELGSDPAPGGRSFNGFRLVRLLGEGGMGVVYLAQQERPHRQVALKIMRPGSISPTMLKRFEHEVEVLGRLQHPGIAQFYESGTAQTDFGPQTFFAMEYVDAVPITEFVRDHALDLRRKLELMTRVCEAVQHAHHRGVIHRDLKPGNILVTADGSLKVVDFGVARLTDANASAFTALTQSGQLVGTLAYMSPEQWSGSPDEVDTRSDVYALGLVMYELLTGRQAQPVVTPLCRGTPPAFPMADPPALRSIDRSLRGDVETIVERTLERDRSRRYQSAAELAADIRRFLKDEPIVARPPSRLYQLRKFVRRNKTFAIAASLVFCALVVGAIATAWQAARARRDAQRVQAVNQFMRSMFASVDPFKSAGDLTVAQMALRASAEIPRLAAGHPELEAAFRYEVGSIFSSLGLLTEAEQDLTRSLVLRESIYGPASAEAIEVVHSLGQLQSRKGRYAQADPLLRKASEVRSTDSADGVAACRAAGDLATTLHAQGKLDEAHRVCLEAWQGLREKLGPRHPDAMAIQVNLASIRRSQKRLAEAESLLAEALGALREALGPAHPNTLLAMANLAQVYKDSKRFVEAEPLYRAAYEGLKGRLGDEHPDTLIATANLAHVLWRLKKTDEAARLYEQAIPAFRRVFGDAHPNVLTTSTYCALVFKDQGRLDQAEVLLARVYEGYRGLFGPDHEKTRLVEKYRDETRAARAGAAVEPTSNP